ncbi:ATP-binding protein [Streptacidiphilus anmyonensis]|uniref:ATP-binding protein n=1 Tax=Streptacidiphilus anmyonensis TaxID=405782 RepID=UPI0005AB49C6|nr:ATP-binding protein [Streptacidiphilus anmyonensis]
MSQPPPRSRSHLLLADTPNAAGWARCHTRDVLRRWQVPPDLIDTVLLVVSELATNAICHPGGTKQPEKLTSADLAKVRSFGLDLQLLGQGVVVQVADRDPRPPVLQEAGEDDEGGRGIFLVEHMSQQWGFYHPQAGGKVVWAEVRLGAESKSPEPASVRPQSNPTGRPQPLQSADEQLPADDPLVIGRVLVGLRGL